MRRPRFIMLDLNLNFNWTQIISWMIYLQFNTDKAVCTPWIILVGSTAKVKSWLEQKKQGLIIVQLLTMGKSL
jgi:hypothetical protein